MGADKNKNCITRRNFLFSGLRFGIVLACGGLGAFVSKKIKVQETVWQIDPHKCIQCGGCQVNCVLSPSAVKCVHVFEICGYCDYCSGFFIQDPPALNTGAENRLCPTGAIIRTFIEDPYFEYKIDESICIGCGKCVKGCSAFGNGSLFLQIRHDRCVNCNQCSIARRCPSGAITRIDANTPCRYKG